MAKTTILRFEKVKHIANVRQAGAHQHRHHLETPNADPALKSKNVTLVGDSNLSKTVQDKLSELTKPPRKNAVLCMDGLLQLSPVLYRDKDGNPDNDRLEVFVDNSEAWLREQFGDNLVSAVLHLDEQTPHIHFTIVPIDTKPDGRKVLNARDMFDKFALSTYQRNYYAHMKKDIPELEPPKHGSKAKHTTVKQFYEQIDAMADAFEAELAEMRKELYRDAKSTILDKLQPHIEKLFVDFEEKLGNPISQDMRKELMSQYKNNAEGVLGFAFTESKTAEALEKRMTEKAKELKNNAKKPFNKKAP
jgi:hypothetical protein